MSLTLEEAAFGVRREITVDTAAVCETCTGSGCAPGTSPRMCPSCGGAGEIQTVQRSFLGNVMTTRGCPACAGTGEQIPSPCPTCGTEGRVRVRRTITVDVPGGIEDGMRIRLSGQGEVGPGGGPPGDLYVEVSEQPHETFTREGSDLHCTVAVPMTSAALGVDLVLTHPRRRGEVRDQARHPERGGAHACGARACRGCAATQRGDLHVHVEVRTPVKLDETQEHLLRELAALRGEEVSVTTRGSGLFGKVRDAFGGR